MAVPRERLNRRDQLLRDYRRRLTRLEIETHRLRAALARLEADDEDAAADHLIAANQQDAAERGQGVPPTRWDVTIEGSGVDRPDRVMARVPHPHQPFPQPSADSPSADEANPGETEIADAAPFGPSAVPEETHEPRPPDVGQDPSDDSAPAVAQGPAGNTVPVDALVGEEGNALLNLPDVEDATLDSEPEMLPLPPVETIAEQIGTGESAAEDAAAARPLWRRIRDMPAWMTSVVVHVAILIVLALVGFVSIQEEVPILAASFGEPVEAAAEELSEIDIQPSELEDSMLTEEVPLPEDAPLSDSDFSESSAGGDLDAFGSDLDALLEGDLLAGDSGGAGQGTGTRRGQPGMGSGASFFGAEAIGDRFVFIVDNSRSMTEGRMETALMELLRSVAAMKPRQSFYVIFQSDTAYKMFHPQPVAELLPATPQHKGQLQAWLQTIELCYGDSRSLPQAVELAESLKPSAVFLLSDGDFSQFTRDRICAAAQPSFVIHTLGMTVRDEVDGQNLLAIAQAHRGTFRPVGVSPAAAEMAGRRPIPRNPRGQGWASQLREPAAPDQP